MEDIKLNIDSELVIKLSNKAMISLDEAETENVLTNLIIFEKEMSELYAIDTSKFSHADEKTNAAKFSDLRDDI